MTEEKKWAYKLNDDKDCWKDLKSYSAAECADTAVIAADGTGYVAALTSKEGAYADGVFVKTCGDKEIVVGLGDAEDAAKTAADGDDTKKTLAYTHTKGDSGCLVWTADAVWVKFTAVGWAEEKAADGDTSGAKHLGAAFAAGALAVAATQF